MLASGASDPCRCQARTRSPFGVSKNKENPKKSADGAMGGAYFVPRHGRIRT